MITIKDVRNYIDRLIINDKISGQEKKHAIKHLRVLLIQSLSRNEARVYNLLLEYIEEGQTYLDVSQKLGIGRTYACNILRSLHLDLGLLVRGLDDNDVRLSRYWVKLPRREKQ